MHCNSPTPPIGAHEDKQDCVVSTNPSNNDAISRVQSQRKPSDSILETCGLAAAEPPFVGHHEMLVIACCHNATIVAMITRPTLHA